MNIAKAKKLAADRGWIFWYDRSLRLWSIIDNTEGQQRETSYIAPAPLKAITEEKFISCYLE